MRQAIRGLRTALAGRPFVGTLLLAFVWLLVMRGMLLLHSGVWSNPGWILLADAVGALVLALLLSIVRATWLRLPLILLIGAAFYSAGQHMWAHGTIFRLAHLGNMVDSLFLSSSVVTWWLLLLPIYCLSAYLLHRLHQRIDPQRPARPLWRLGAAAGCIVTYGLAVTSLTAPSNNVVVSLLAQLPDTVMGGRRPPAPDEVEPVKRNIENVFFHRDVRGERVDDPPNVLLVVIEGLSAAYLPAVAEYHGLSPAVSLPTLQRHLDRTGFRIYLNVLSMQRQTDRGSFPMLCGAYPRVGTTTPKMADVAAGHADPVCMPEVLKRHGYRTGYLQAAPLEFMNKDVFMPKAGFERVDGVEYFDPPEDTQGWGPADDVFFAGAANWLRELDTDDGPWFAATLNAGTHHPFPAGAAERAKPEGEAAVDTTEGADNTVMGAQRDRQAAFAVMAQELIGFLDSLAAADRLNDTLVIITSDESGGFIRGEEEPRLLDGNFGALAVRPPHGLSLDDFAARDALVATLDVALTILDMAGIADHSPAARAMIGRSLLAQRRSAKRGLLIGDTYAGHTVFLLESGELLACGEGLVVCSSWQFSPQRPFGTLNQVTTPAFLDSGTRAQLVDRAAVIDEPPEAGE